MLKFDSSSDTSILTDVAILSPYPWGPPTTGVQARIYNLAKNLGQNGINITIFAGGVSGRTDLKNVSSRVWSQLRVLETFQPVTIHNARRLPRLTWSTIRSFEKFLKYDAILSEVLSTTVHGLLLQGLTRRFSILDEHNVEWSVARQLGKRSRYDWRRLHTFETYCWKRFDHITATSELDRRKMLTSGVPDSKITLVPNGVDCDVFFQDEKSRETVRNIHKLSDAFAILFMGTYGYSPNVDAVETILEEIYKPTTNMLPKAMFMIMGPKADRLSISSTNNILVVGMAKDVVPYINASDICIAPIRSGSGTRLKILEWMACGKPVIASSKAVEGLDVSHMQNVIVEDDFSRYPIWISRLADDAGLRNRLGRNAEALIRSRYDWKVCSKPLVSLLKEVNVWP